MTSKTTTTMLDRADELMSSQGDHLSFSTTVARHLVHRQAVAEVLLTDWCQTRANTFICAAQWSRSHSFYRVRHGRYDPLLLAETIRQVGLLLCHEAYQIPGTYRFLMDRMIYDADLNDLKVGAAPAEIVLVVRVEPVGRRTSLASALCLDVEFLRDRVPIGRGAGWVRCLEPLLYRRLRPPQCARVTWRQQQPAPLLPAQVGMLDADDVVLGHCGQPGEWPLRVLTEHPVLFDHPLDHVPGMLGLEGMRQASRAIVGWPDAQVTACDVTFLRFIDLDASSSVRVTVGQQSATSAGLHMVLVQSGHTAAQGSVTITNLL